MARLIDSSVFIELERRGLTLVDLIRIVPGQLLSLAAITASELLVGVERANTPQRRLRRAAFVEAILKEVPLLPFDLPIARTHARIWAQLAAVGQRIDEHDLIIAATALVHGYTVLTQNPRHFRRVIGLAVQVPDW